MVPSKFTFGRRDRFSQQVVPSCMKARLSKRVAQQVCGSSLELCRLAEYIAKLMNA